MTVEVPVRTRREKPVAARRVKKKRPNRRWIRNLMKLVLYVSVAAVVTRFAIAKVNRPLQLLKEQMHESAVLTEQLQRLKAENKVLRRRLIYIRDKRGAAQEARRLGYVKPGEVLLVLPSDLPPNDAKTDRR
ncbi:MAG: septum formation initiator family protein [Armatimonadota bacterium]|nr:septum formation initiator family protein [Armatimonadota bacterium]